MLYKPYFKLVSPTLLSSLISSWLVFNTFETSAYQLEINSDKLSAASDNKDNHIPPYTPSNGTESGGEARWGPPHSGRQSAGDTRSDCPNVDTPLTALIPNTHFGVTTTQTPTLWFYNPYSAEDVDRGVFVLQNADGFDVIEPIQFTLPESPGFISVTVPDINPHLEFGEEYFWAFEVYCVNVRTPLSVEGWINPEPPSTEIIESLEVGESPSYQIYLENSIWFDAVNELAQLRLDQPLDNTLESEWLRLLEDGGLDTQIFQSTPMVGPVIIQD